MRVSIVLFILIVIWAVFVSTRIDQSVQQGSFVVQLYTDTCLKFIGKNALVSDFAKASNYVRADEQFSKAVLQNDEGEVWGVPSTTGLLVVLKGETHCSAWAKIADVKKVNEAFEQIVLGIARPGLTVKQISDKVSDGVGGKYRQLGYFIQKDNTSQGYVMLSTTSDSPAAEVQVRLTMSPSAL